MDGSIAGYSYATPDLKGFFQDMGFTQINVTVSEGTGSSILTPWQFAGVDRNYLDVVDKNSVVITEYSKDYEAEMANRGLPVKMVPGLDMVDIVDAMHVDYNTSQEEIRGRDHFDIVVENDGGVVGNEKFIEIKMIIPEGLRGPMALDTN